jgi:hypothetical protein
LKGNPGSEVKSATQIEIQPSSGEQITTNQSGFGQASYRLSRNEEITANEESNGTSARLQTDAATREAAVGPNTKPSASLTSKVVESALEGVVATTSSGESGDREAAAADAAQEKKINKVEATSRTKKGAAASAPVELRVAEEVLKLGGTVTVEKMGTLYEVPVTRAEEIPFEPFRIESVRMSSRIGVTSDMTRLMSELPSIREIHLDGTDIDDERLSQLPPFDGLRDLRLTGTRITDNSAAWIASHADLRILYLDRTAITGEALKEIKKLRRLRALVLDSTAIADEGLKELASHPTLWTLTLANNKMLTGEGIAKLQSLPCLQELYLSGTMLGDEILEFLPKCLRLRLINVAGSRVTSDGAIRLQTLLSKAVVVHPAVPLAAELKAEDWVRSQNGTASLIKGIRVTFDARFSESGGPSWGAENLVGMRAISNLTCPSLRNAVREIETIAKLESLHTLDIHLSDLSDAGLKRLAALKQLNYLHLGDCKRITEAGFRQIGAFESLSSLLLGGTPVNDNGLVFVGRLPNLRDFLGLRNCRNISSDGIRHLTGLT